MAISCWFFYDEQLEVVVMARTCTLRQYLNVLKKYSESVVSSVINLYDLS